jgi:hypothetical protein
LVAAEIVPHAKVELTHTPAKTTKRHKRRGVAGNATTTKRK